MKLIQYFIISTFVVLFISCSANVPPNELIEARQAYEKASMGQALQLVPDELHKARIALKIAEDSFKDEPDSYKTRDLAYVADRKAKIAEGLANSAAEKAATDKANIEYLKTQTEIIKKTKDDLLVSEKEATMKAEQLASEKRARLDADKRALKAQEDLAKLAAKEEARGLVITLSGSVLFASNESVLMPTAQTKLNEVAEALLATKERKLTVEGHTDSQGSLSHNQALSQKRADAVRSYIISQGYPSDLIQARGIGEERPIADNNSVEGRANNRRVEIIVDRIAK
ncbi:MAG: OmpA family protein [Bacteroidetes bacterium]|nr:OmpA family protein [Bacteroidota bacterium]